MTTPERNASTGSPAVSRRAFLQSVRGRGCRRGGGHRGHRGRAARARLRPGHAAQHRPVGRLHPRGDVELKRQMPEAGKALGRGDPIRDHQRQRPPAAHHRRHPVGQRRRHLHMLHNWPHLYQNALVDVSDVANVAAKEQGALLRGLQAIVQVGGKWLGMPALHRPQPHRLPEVVVRRDRRHRVPQDLR